MLNGKSFHLNKNFNINFFFLKKGTQWEDMDCNCGDVAKTVCVERTVESCPEELGWEVVHGRCFYFSVNESTYEDAENDCIDKGGRLFEPKNAEANELVRRDFALNDFLSQMQIRVFKNSAVIYIQSKNVTHIPKEFESLESLKGP